VVGLAAADLGDAQADEPVGALVDDVVVGEDVDVPSMTSSRCAISSRQRSGRGSSIGATTSRKLRRPPPLERM
jgi:hypothetical protein